jgi:hypothetical protein
MQWLMCVGVSVSGYSKAASLLLYSHVMCARNLHCLRK